MSEQQFGEVPPEEQHDENADALAGEEVEPDVDYDPDTFADEGDEDEEGD